MLVSAPMARQAAHPGHVRLIWARGDGARQASVDTVLRGESRPGAGVTTGRPHPRRRRMTGPARARPGGGVLHHRQRPRSGERSGDGGFGRKALIDRHEIPSY